MDTAYALFQVAGLSPATHPLAGGAAGLVWLLPLLPLLGAVVNGLVSLSRDTDNGTAKLIPTLVGPGVLLAAFALTVAIFMQMRGIPRMEAPLITNYASWMPVGNLQINWGIQLDQLSILMCLIITGVGTLIHVFSVGYMVKDPGYARYFAYLNLFVTSMLILVLGSSYPVLFVGWEGVGLCSYLLIGFWFGDRANAEAGKKAFVVNRIGDFGFLIAMFLIWVTVGSLDFATANPTLAGLPPGSPVIVAVALFLFLGCAGKSAQLPLYIWLPDAMAGPTPVSALIHAATMVTAGVYLIARSSLIFAAAPQASLVVALIGALTAFWAATIALRQWDIKKVLAYSTVSQLGYMFVGVGVGAYSAGVFHLVTHAFFKALLFLGAGSVIHSLHHAYHHTHRDSQDAQDLRNMGGLRKYMPVTAIAMTLATLAIVGIPPLAGFFSKDEILSSAFARAQGSPLSAATLGGIPGSTVLYIVYGLGMLTALLTGIYMTRMLLLAFYGSNRTGDHEREALHEAPSNMTGPVVVLAVLTVVAGWLNLPKITEGWSIGKPERLTEWLEPVTGAGSRMLSGAAHLSHETEYALIGAAVAVGVLGIIFAYVGARAPIANKDASPADTGFSRVLANAYNVDGILDSFVVRPVNALSAVVLDRGIDRSIDRGIEGTGAAFVRFAGRMGARLQNGDVGVYAWLVAAGAIAVLGSLVLGQ
ncbi:MAG: NADH-quinone oxidoreductase subunit L [Phycisphaerae bacterium]|nr:NADH-quinone oxidoreductase subunit L [Gemmatimonadaceae bacterium]